MRASRTVGIMYGVSLVLFGLANIGFAADDFQRLEYNHPGLVVDLGVGLWAWPLPMDYDRDGDLDLLVACPDTPFKGTYFFRNESPDEAMPVLKRNGRIGSGMTNVQVSSVGGTPRVLVPGFEYLDFRRNRFKKKVPLGIDKIHETTGRIRANQWKYCDFDNDGAMDLMVGIGDWTDYGWDDAFDAQGNWTRGPLHGYVYLVRNAGTTAMPKWEKPQKLTAGGAAIDVFGMPTPNLADFDGDGDLDLVCGEFLDKLTYFENRSGKPGVLELAPGKPLSDGTSPIVMDLQMIVPVAIDWDGDGDVDLIVGEEDGRVVFVENSGEIVDGMPRFLPPRFFQQQADLVKFGALTTPVSVDWDGDGDEDLIVGNTAGYIGFIENLGGNPPRWAAPVYLKSDGEVIRIQAGPNGSIQGPCEAKWGYTTLSVADWDHDGLLDLIVNSIWGKIVWYRNVGKPSEPKLTGPMPVEVAWPGTPPKPAWNWWDPAPNELVTQWRTTPVAIDFNGDGLCDLVMMDHEGYLAFYERFRDEQGLKLRPGARIFVDAAGQPLRLNPGTAGKSGRRKIHLVDWDGDGTLDLLVDSINADFYRGRGWNEKNYVFEKVGAVAEQRLAGHSTSPTTVDWQGTGQRDLLIGAEDGHFYFLANPHRKE